MNLEIICAGFGGQGVLTAGLLLAEAGYRKGWNLTWYPSYGSEMRGGTANCNVKLSQEAIGSPYCSELDVLVAMNQPSADRFEGMVKNGGLLLYNSDMMEKDRVFRPDLKTIGVPANQLAAKAGNGKGANLVMLGMLEKELTLFGQEEFLEAITGFFDKKGKSAFTEKNRAAFEEGYKLY